MDIAILGAAITLCNLGLLVTWACYQTHFNRVMLKDIEGLTRRVRDLEAARRDNHV